MSYVSPFGPYYSVYAEKPVDIMTFIQDDYFLGKFTLNGKKIYPFWQNALEKQCNLNYKSVCFATAYGTGKTLNSIIFAIYRLYQIMCLKNINEFYRFNEHDLSSFVFAAVNEKSLDNIRWTFIHAIFESRWFMSHGRFEDHNYIPNNRDFSIKFIHSEDGCYGEQIIGFYLQWLCDNFNGHETANLYNQLDARVISRTSVGDVLYGKEVIDFDVISRYYNCWNNKITGSQWEVKPYGTFDMSKVFGIVTNGVKGKSKIVEFNSGVTIDIPEDYKLIIVPYQLLNDAKLSLDMFLNNFAGIHLREDSEND